MILCKSPFVAKTRPTFSNKVNNCFLNYLFTISRPWRFPWNWPSSVKNAYFREFLWNLTLFLSFMKVSGFHRQHFCGFCCLFCVTLEHSGVFRGRHWAMPPPAPLAWTQFFFEHIEPKKFFFNFWGGAQPLPQTPSSVGRGHTPPHRRLKHRVLSSASPFTRS